MKPDRFLLAILLAAFSLSAAEDEKPAFTILFTAETHGALLPCDCPLQPLGGVARRATLIQRYRARGPVLLVDAGHWSAGSLYDEDSDGDPERDKLRTDLMAKAMALMKYDAILADEGEARELKAIGVEQALQDRKPDAAHDVQASPNGILVACEGFLRSGERWARKVLPAEFPPARFDLALSQMGEEQSEALTKERSWHFLVNAGRKTTARVSWTAGDTVIANFDYQAQRLGVAEVFPRKGWKPGDSGPRWEIRVTHVPLTPEIPDDPAIAALLAPHKDVLKKRGKKKVPVEYWTLPECPYCTKLEPELLRIAAELGERIEIVPHFLVDKAENGAFFAMHGEAELREAGIQAIVAKYYPRQFFAWKAWRNQNREASWEDGAKALGLLKARIRGALEAGEHREIFEQDYQLARSRRVEGTPTLVLGQRVYDGEHERLKILRVLCGMLDEPKPEACKKVPTCFHDAECRKRGFIGTCVEAGEPAARCDFSQQAVRVPSVVLVEAATLYSNHERILEVLLGDLPGLVWRIVDPHSAEGAALVAKHEIARYPAYLLDPIAKSEHHFAERLGGAVDERAGMLVLRPELQGAHRLAKRARIPGRADLFVSRFSKNGQQAVDVALEAMGWRDAPDLAIHDGLYWERQRQPDGSVKKELAARGGIAEIEDAAVALAVRRLAPEKLPAYLAERGKRRGSQFGWDRALEAAGVDVTQVRKLAEGPAEEIRTALYAGADLLEELNAGGDVVFLAENCELIPVRSRAELSYYLERIGKRKVKE